MKNLALFTRQLAALLQGGLPLVEGLNQLARVFPRREFKDAATGLAQGLAVGDGFSEQLTKYPRLFPHFYRSVTEIGESGDSLLPALVTLGGYYEDREKIRNRLLRILFYPVLLLGVAAASGVVALWCVAPGFSGLYSALGVEAPGASRWLFALAEKATPLRLLAGTAAFVLVTGVVTWRFVRRVQWRTLARLPLVRTVFCYWFCKVTAMITSAGHTLEQALAMAGAVAPRGPAPEALVALKKGESLYAGLAGSPGILRSFVAQGEKVGELPEALARATEYYDQQLEESMENFQRVLEPLSVLVVGGMVGVMLLILMLPVLQLAKAF